jgi:predicted O-methyltransferase YrrM
MELSRMNLTNRAKPLTSLKPAGRKTRDTMALTLQHTMENARALREDFAQSVRGEPYELKGIMFSEVLFILASIHGLKPKRLFESGRARGQSTYLLGKLLPQTTIISIDIDPLSDDVEIASRRLQPLANVRQCFGDSRRIVPPALQSGDMVLIDGPKGYRALRLALNCLLTGKPSAVFIHDVYQSLDERRFLQRHLPEAFYSDALEFVTLTQVLDELCWRTLEQSLPGQCKPFGLGTGETHSYGFTVACIPRTARDYRSLLVRANLDSIWNRLCASSGKVRR